MTKRIRTTRRLEVWLKDTSVALFVLNSQRRLVFFNVGCEHLTGWTPAAVLGQVCDFVTEIDGSSPAAVLASLSPPAAVWQGETATVPGYVAHREHDPIACVIHFYPLTDAEQKVQATLGIIQQVTPATTLIRVPKSQTLHAELAALRYTLRQQSGAASLIARDPGMRRVLGQLRLAQQSSLPVLFVGEAGTGREHMARLVHEASDHGRRTFVPLDCRRLPAGHLEDTLRRMTESHHPELLQPGTLYLDQIDGLPRDLQRLVLDLIESKNVKGLRVMAASQQSLEPLVEANDFLRELLFALTTLAISIPALRSRPSDIEPLAQYFLEELNRADTRQVNGFDDDVWQQLQRYNWPGNVSELRAVVTEARLACSGPLIESVHLPFRFRAGASGQSVGPVIRKRTVLLDPLLLQVEREQIELALAEARQNKARAAELLGITRPRLYRRMDVLGIADPDTEATDRENG